MPDPLTPRAEGRLIGDGGMAVSGFFP